MNMLKGVHHQIVEIRQTEDPFFERALLFVRPQCAERSEEQWQESGRLFLKRVKPYTGLRRSRLRYGLQLASCLLSGGGIGVVVGVILTKLG